MALLTSDSESYILSFILLPAHFLVSNNYNIQLLCSPNLYPNLKKIID